MAYELLDLVRLRKLYVVVHQHHDLAVSRPNAEIDHSSEIEIVIGSENSGSVAPFDVGVNRPSSRIITLVVDNHEIDIKLIVEFQKS